MIKPEPTVVLSYNKFRKLPRELLDKIYVYAGIPKNQKICIRGSSPATFECGLHDGTFIRKGEAQIPNLAKVQTAFGILLANRVLFKDIAERLYHRNVFVFENPASCTMFMSKIGDYDNQPRSSELAHDRHISRITLERYVPTSFTGLLRTLNPPATALRKIHFKDVATALQFVPGMNSIIRSIMWNHIGEDKDGTGNFMLGLITTTPSPHSTCSCQDCVERTGNAGTFSALHVRTTCLCEACRPWREASQGHYIY